MSPASRADHNRFCLTEGWTVVRDARGRTVRHHITYELALPDGRLLRTRVSRPADNTAYGPGLWHVILRDQLDVTEDEFWACVSDKQLPRRGRAPNPVPTRALPAGLVYQLIHVAHVPESDVANLSLVEANARMAEHWSRTPRDR